MFFSRQICIQHRITLLAIGMLLTTSSTFIPHKSGANKYYFSNFFQEFHIIWSCNLAYEQEFREFSMNNKIILLSVTVSKLLRSE